MENFCAQFVGVFCAGGYLMYPLVLLALYMYWTGFGICFRVRSLNALCADSEKFARAFSDFAERNYSAQSAAPSAKDVFERLGAELLAGEERRLKMLKILSSVAPLIGLLGTVAGISVAIASSGESSEGVARGISTALITTQAGLVAAIPAWILAMSAAASIRVLRINLARREAAMHGRSAL
mgnify:FL=1